MICRAIISLLALFTMVVIAVGCGDDSSSGSSHGGTIETSSLTKAEFVKSANEICERGSGKYIPDLGRYLQMHASNSKGEGEVAADAVRQTVLPVIEAQNKEIEELGAPDGDQAQIEAFLAEQRQSIASLERRRSLSLNTDLGPAFRQAGELARRYGLGLCAYG